MSDEMEQAAGGDRRMQERQYESKGRKRECE